MVLIGLELYDRYDCLSDINYTKIKSLLDVVHNTVCLQVIALSFVTKYVIYTKSRSLNIHCNHPIYFIILPSNQARPSQCCTGAVPHVIPNNGDPYFDSAGNSGHTSQHLLPNCPAGMACNLYAVLE